MQRSNGSRQYWVVGGEFRDTSFRELAGSPPEAFGPFDSYDAALRTWRTRVADTQSLAHVRYVIAENGGLG